MTPRTATPARPRTGPPRGACDTSARRAALGAHRPPDRPAALRRPGPPVPRRTPAPYAPRGRGSRSADLLVGVLACLGTMSAVALIVLRATTATFAL